MANDPRDFLASFQSVLDDMYQTAKAKNADYTGGGSPFDNFKLVEKLGITTTEKGMLVRMCDKLARIHSLLDRPPEVKNEKIEDTLLDLANYAILLMLYIESKDNRYDLQELDD